MKRGKDSAENEATVPGVGPLVLVWRLLKTLLLLAIISYVSCLLISRTDGFRTLAAEQIEKRTGLAVKIGKSRCTAALDVMFERLTLEETGSVVQARAACERASVIWHLPRPFGTGQPMEWTLDGVELAMARHEGAWHPAAFADAAGLVANWLKLPLPKDAPPAAARKERPGDRPARPEAEEWPSWSGPRVKVALRDGRMNWWTGQPEPAADVAGLRLTVTPLDAPERPMMHYLLEAQAVSAQGQPMAAPLRLELLECGDRQILLDMRVGRDSDVPSAR